MTGLRDKNIDRKQRRNKGDIEKERKQREKERKQSEKERESRERFNNHVFSNSCLTICTSEKELTRDRKRESDHSHGVSMATSMLENQNWKKTGSRNRPNQEILVNDWLITSRVT